MHLSEILDEQIGRLARRLDGLDITTGVRVIETGTIRNADPVYAADDGWSTLHFAKHPSVTNVISIDLDTQVARRVLETEVPHWESKVWLYEDHSIQRLGQFLLERTSSVSVTAPNLAFLDSDNDPTLILCEYLLVTQMMPSGSIVIVDDCDFRDGAAARKGLALAPWLRQHSIPYEVVERRGTNVSTGVLITEVP